jgi:hypothetical protein
MSTRWVKCLKQGDRAVIHGNTGRHPTNVTDEAIRKKIIALKKSGIDTQANFTHLRELLEEKQQIKVSYTTRSGILKEAGITSPETHRSVGERRTMRTRRATWRELVQTDASPFDWFGLDIQ